MSDQYHEIKLPGCVVFITTTELLQILQKDPQLWESVLRRGKAFKRAKQAREREPQQLSKYHRTKNMIQEGYK